MPAIEWEQWAVVVRSRCHDRTWIAHVSGAGFDDTPAGPLNLVKRAVIEMVGDEDRHRWRHNPESDVWILELAERS